MSTYAKIYTKLLMIIYSLLVVICVGLSAKMTRRMKLCSKSLLTFSMQYFQKTETLSLLNMILWRVLFAV